VADIRNAQFSLYKRDSIKSFSSYKTKILASAFVTLYYVCVYGSVLQLMKQMKDYHKNLHQIYATQLLIAYMSIYLLNT